MQIYLIIHYWGDDKDDTTEFLMACDHIPTEAEAVIAGRINYDASRGESMSIKAQVIHGAKLLIDVGDVDWAMLREQKLELLKDLEDPMDGNEIQESAMEWIVNLLDSIQDQAAKDLGEEAVFGHLTTE